ncbi:MULTISPECIES: protein-L-isoaspartate(D-aspartate) O-methyltransferase [unclassified Agarivorans]|uniref:protein-L-isoaspartate(D-aspartate) O-methyltransferase n=1 Tax=unclassified Agarivorans TaxID=2636026 RepID=UPI0010E90407|nr:MULTISPECIES: protein-L-isoaspartate(D-aspartate) O-methyltransferase [unclassified Agarivorans]MDO6684286.1 protein-L-isoaspartate(D-aspartate) O-methyltransferase [Agarivorans sp. 3_MG-2023]MDO6714452.1 protein-L-isoaspartate(D-aspartate) O-methyltransferase [Agarivorans sp. 2_MG-2023]MDO6763159.1 protein-L-isoaspartate(D-aspartate) O-methyltransferase [Agarivorans sp. 1_MG-2023]GDY24416.1 protein-L-isoaspartate O-methyltransferase [Agarivorans sp. Toyoura001]
MQFGESPNSLKLVNQLRQHGIQHTAVLNAIAKLPRQYFIDEALAHQAWDNTALPIGQGQTLSQPYIVAKMTEILLQTNPKKVLEIGTGSGYQTAVLASLVDQVYSVERIKTLQFQAKRRLKLLDLHNVATKHGDGWKGWSSKGPFDAIIVTAAAAAIPEALVAQLSVGGRMIIPVGEQQQQQTLVQIEKQAQGFTQHNLEPVRFVPLINGELA